MMDHRYEHIEQLLELFFDGGTTSAQERELYAFFNGGEVPEHLGQYKQVFAYFESGMSAEMSEPVQDGQSSEVNGRENKDRTGRRNALIRFLLPAMAVASMLAMFFIRPAAIPANDSYEGSFVVRNGVRITDPEVVEAEAQAVMNVINSEMQAYERLEKFLLEIEGSSVQSNIEPNTNVHN